MHLRRQPGSAAVAGRGLRGDRSRLAGHRRHPEERLAADAAYRDFDAEERFQISGIHTDESPLCKAGDVLRGAIKPGECPAFGKECTPRHPLGATMVSSEGACAAYFNYGRFLSAEELATAGSAASGAVGMAESDRG